MRNARFRFISGTTEVVIERKVGETTRRKRPLSVNSAPYPQGSEGKIKYDLFVFHKIKGSNLFEGACHNNIYCKIHYFFIYRN